MTLRPIRDVAGELGISLDEIAVRGDDVAKIRFREPRPRRGKLVLVTATTPTQRGEGKTVTAIALADALRRLGLTSAVTLRQPSMGPLLGSKGGGTGGGSATVEPSSAIDLHFTGDIHAVGSAQNLLAAMTDASVHHGNPLRIAADRPMLPRCLDINDRAMRRVGFVITAASESMSILSLATDHADLKARMGRMIVGVDDAGAIVTASDIQGQGAAAAVLADALLPNLVQTIEGTPAFVHGGSFANLGIGHSSVAADRIALARADIVVTETGFGAELGAEKFVHLVAPVESARPDVAVLVTSVRAIAEHGLANLDAHLGILATLGIPAVVALNRFPDDADEAVARVLRHAEIRGIPSFQHTGFRDGGAGALDLATGVLGSIDKRTPAGGPLYGARDPFEEKLALLCERIYGASHFEISPKARASLAWCKDAGLDRLPLCVAKTPLSLTDDPAARGAPRGWTFRVHDVVPHAGAGHLVVLAGNVITMPGLGPDPAARRMDVDERGRVVGLRA